jgi:hypothetical protein
MLEQIALYQRLINQKEPLVHRAAMPRPHITLPLFTESGLFFDDNLLVYLRMNNSFF